MVQKGTPEFKRKRRNLIITDSVLAVLNILLLFLIWLMLHKTFGPIGEDSTKDLSFANITKSIQIGVDITSDNRCDISMLNEQTGNVVFFDKHGTNETGAIHFVNNDSTHFLSVYYNSHGFIESICNENLTAVFSNYNGSLVDIAIVRGDRFRLIPKCDAGTPWIAGQSSPVIIDIADEDSVVVDSAVINNYDNEKNYYLAKAPMLNQRLLMADKILKLVSMNGYPEIANDAAWALNVLDKSTSTGGNSYGKFIDGYNIVKADIAFNEYFEKLSRSRIRYDKLNQSLIDCNEWIPFYKWWFECFDHQYDASRVERQLGLGSINTGNGALKVTLAWPFYADIDVHVIEPGGSEISYQNKRSNISDGFLDHDDMIGGNAIENVYWRHPRSGHYKVYLKYFGLGHSGRRPNSGNCKVTIIKNGEGGVFNVHLSHIGETTAVAEFDI